MKKKIKIETGWLIELNDINDNGKSMCDYWCCPNSHPDPFKAIRFSRKEDGERMVKFLLEKAPMCSPQGKISITEHQFYCN